MAELRTAELRTVELRPTELRTAKLRGAERSEVCSEAAYRAPSPRRAVRVAHRVERGTQSEARRTAKLYAELSVLRFTLLFIVWVVVGAGGPVGHEPGATICRARCDIMSH